MVVFLARCGGVWLGLAALCEAAEVDALVGADDGTFVVSELVGDPTLQETRISSIGSTHGVFTQPSIHRDMCLDSSAGCPRKPDRHPRALHGYPTAEVRELLAHSTRTAASVSEPRSHIGTR